jgi:hypothetical protein
MTLFFSPSEQNQGFDATLDDTVLDLLDLAWMIDKERELHVVVVFFETLNSIYSHDPLLS